MNDKNDTNIKNLKDKTMSNDSTKTNGNVEKGFFRASAADFKKIPGSPIAYWVGENVRTIFLSTPKLEDSAKPRQGMASSDDKRFVRQWTEVSWSKIGIDCGDATIAKNTNKKWFPYDKGGSYRKWYGNNEFLVNWENDGKEVLGYAASLYGSPTRTIKSISMYFREGITWTAITSGKLSVRFSTQGHIFSNAGMKVFSSDYGSLIQNLGFLNSIVSEYLVNCLSQTLNFDQGIIARLPIKPVKESKEISHDLINYSKSDWDLQETSWDFKSNTFLLGYVSYKITRQSS